MEMLCRYYSGEERSISSSEMGKLALKLGNEFICLVYLVEHLDENDNSGDFFHSCLKMKVRAKKQKALNGLEILAENYPEIEVAINAYLEAFAEEELATRKEAERLQDLEKQKQAIKAKENFKLLEIEREKQNALYLKKYSDFPEFDINRIKRGSQAYKILKTLQNGSIKEQDFLWLDSKGFNNEYVTEAFYLKRANSSLNHWQNTKKPWSLVNAIADYRKGNSPQQILNVVKANYPFKFSRGNKKLNAALLTTSGGVYRDLHQYEESLKMGTEANQIAPSDFRPCTLLGASNILLGNVSEGYSWYQKAIEFGFKPDSYDNELRSVYMRCSKQIKNEFRNDLLSKGYRYSWLN